MDRIRQQPLPSSISAPFINFPRKGPAMKNIYGPATEVSTRGIMLALLLITSIALSACGSSSLPTSTLPQDKLAEIVDRGRLIIATDPAYPPQSELKPKAER